MKYGLMYLKDIGSMKNLNFLLCLLLDNVVIAQYKTNEVKIIK